MTTTPHLKTRTVTIPVADGTQMPAFHVLPEHKGELPGVIVLQEIFGVNSHIKDVAKRLAQAGFVAIAPELFHRTAPGFHGSYDDLAGGQAEAKKLTVAGVDADLRAAYAYMNADPHVKNDCLAVMGMCMGGRLAFIANSIAPLKAAVSFYGSAAALPNLPELVASQHGPLLTAWGGRDKHISLEQTRKVEDLMHAVKKPYVNVVFHEAGHGFLCDERSDYHPASADQAWALTLAFLKTHLH